MKGGKGIAQADGLWQSKKCNMRPYSLEHA